MSDIQDLEQGISDAENLLERRQMAMRLANNRDFRILFIDGYFLQDAARLAQMSTDPRIDPKIQASALDEARATGFMRRFLSDCIQMGAVAERELPDMHATLEELRGVEDGHDISSVIWEDGGDE